MKSVFAIALLALSASSFAMSSGRSWFLESHYGKLALVNGQYACTLTNTTGADLDIKRVEFNFERRVGKTREVVTTKSVNSVIYAGETLTVSSGVTAALIGDSCKFLAR